MIKKLIKSKSLPDFTMKVIEEPRILLLWLQLNLELPEKSKYTFSLLEKLGMFLSIDWKASKRVARMWKDGSAETKGKGIRFSN